MQTAFDPQKLAQEMHTLEIWISQTLALYELSTIEPNRNDVAAALGLVDMLLRTWQERLG